MRQGLKQVYRLIRHSLSGRGSQTRSPPFAARVIFSRRTVETRASRRTDGRAHALLLKAIVLLLFVRAISLGHRRRIDRSFARSSASERAIVKPQLAVEFFTSAPFSFPPRTALPTNRVFVRFPAHSCAPSLAPAASARFAPASSWSFFYRNFVAAKPDTPLAISEYQSVRKFAGEGKEREPLSLWTPLFCSLACSYLHSV